MRVSRLAQSIKASEPAPIPDQNEMAYQPPEEPKLALSQRVPHYASQTLSARLKRPNVDESEKTEEMKQLEALRTEREQAEMAPCTFQPAVNTSNFPRSKLLRTRKEELIERRKQLIQKQTE